MNLVSLGWWVNDDLPLWCINIEEAKSLNSLPFHFDNFPMRSEFLRKLKNKFAYKVYSINPESRIFYGFYLSRDDNEERQVHECI